MIVYCIESQNLKSDMNCTICYMLDGVYECLITNHTLLWEKIELIPQIVIVVFFLMCNCQYL